MKFTGVSDFLLWSLKICALLGLFEALEGESKLHVEEDKKTLLEKTHNVLS